MLLLSLCEETAEEEGGGGVGGEAPPGPRCYISRPLSGTGQRGWRAKSRRHRGGGGEMGSNNLRWWEETEEMMATKGRTPGQRQRRSAPRGPTYMWQKCIRKTDGSRCPASRSSTIPASPPSPHLVTMLRARLSFCLMGRQREPGGGGESSGGEHLCTFHTFHAVAIRK